MPSEYVRKIAEIPPFLKLMQPMRDRLAEILAELGEPRVLADQQVLYTMGAEDLNTGAILIEGVLTVDFGHDEPRKVSAPNILGEMQQYNQYGQRMATVKAEGYATVVEFSWHAFVERVRQAPSISETDRLEIQRAFEELIGDRLADLDADND